MTTQTITPAVTKRDKNATSKVADPKDKGTKFPVRSSIKTTSRAKPEVNKKAFNENYAFPSSYNVTNLTLIARDPHWIHAYWEIAPSLIEKTKKQIGSDLNRSPYTLRMYDVTSIDFNGNNANHWFDIDVNPQANKWYISLWNDNVNYCGEIGIKTPEGKFHAFARSNVVNTPRASISGRTDLIWMDARDNQAQQPFVITPPKAKKVGESSSSTSHYTSKGKKPGKKIYLTEDDIRVYYSNLFPLLSRVRGNRRSKNKSGGLRSLKDIIGYDLKEGYVLEDVFIGGMSKSEYFKKILLGSSDELVLKGGASEQKGGASEREEKKRKFFFEIGTELIVYGRTEPDAKVWLGNKNIKLRNDGTFTLRFALPDGNIPLDFVAESADKVEKRTIQTSVVRTKTMCSP